MLVAFVLEDFLFRQVVPTTSAAKSFYMCGYLRMLVRSRTLYWRLEKMESKALVWASVIYHLPAR